MHILFMCVANSARSQIAEGLARTLFNDRVTIMSAGIHPAGGVHPGAVAVLEEIGVDISAAQPKLHSSLPPRFLVNLDVAITLCEENVCPELATKTEHLRWAIADPVLVHGDGQMDAFRAARDELKQRLEAFGRKHQLLQ